MKRYLIAIALLALFAPSALYPEIRCYSRILPDFPTEKDSVCIETCNYIEGGILIDSSLSITGNDIRITYTAASSLIAPHLAVGKNYLGTLSSGYYRLITDGFLLKTGTGTEDTTYRSHETLNFEVLPATTKPLRIVGYNLFIGYYYVDDFHPKRSYYYWNGDTLTIGMAFYYGSFASRFFAGIQQSSDAIVIDMIDTTFRQAPAFNGYIAVTSLAPVPQSTRNVRISRNNWGPYNNYSDPNFHQFTADPHSRGIGLSFRKPGTPEFILCPNDTMYMNFWIPSLLLDTLKILSFQPNPYFKTTGTGRIFIHDIVYNDTLIEDWESYNKDDWHYETVQEGDSIAFDTVNNSTGTDHWMRMTYSNAQGDPVKGYVYKSLAAPYISSAPEPSLWIFGAVKEPDSVISGVMKMPDILERSMTAPLIRYSGSHISARFFVNNSCTINRSDKMDARVTDLQGKLVRVLRANDIHSFGNGILAVWDKRDSRNSPVPRGVYFLNISLDRWCDCAVVVVR